MDSDGFWWTCCLCQKDPIICAFYPVITPALPGWIIIRHHTEKWKASVCTHTYTHTYMATAFMCPSWWSSQGESFQNWSMKAEMESGEHLKPQNFLGSVFNDVWGLMEPINSALGFFFFLCCLKPDDMHSGATWLSELVVEYKVSFVQQGEETL